MKSFKKVSLVIAAALTGAMLVTPNAQAAVSTALTVNGVAATGGTTSTAPVALPVPADNSVDAADALKIAVSGLDTGTAVSAVASGVTIVPALATSLVPVTASSGTSSLTINTGTGTTAEFYVYTKTTAVGSVAITAAGNTTVYYVQGTAGALNSISLTVPSTGAAGTVQTLKVSGYDVFGNLKSGATINTLVSNNGVATSTALTTDSAVATLGTKTQDITLPASGSVTVTAYATVASAVTGLASPVGSAVAVITVRDLATELAVANAALAAEKSAHDADNAKNAKALADANSASAIAKAASDLAAATYKAQYNALAKKWNKAHPKAKVALIK
jgi:hypothetical protein